MLDFFNTGRLLREVSSTIIALVPKTQIPASQKDFRPISCCNVVYKIITKIIANRLKKVLPNLISNEQSAFIPGRRIADNILLAHELVHCYDSRKCPPRCMLKIDLMKAFDMVNWHFLNGVMLLFGFPKPFVDRIMTCISPVRYSVCINGELQGNFPASRGLRQGDPLSPLLFTIVMEILSRLIKVRATRKEFCYHWRCHKAKLTHLCFADDLLIFSRADCHSVSIMLNTLQEFAAMLGLRCNPSKSFVFVSSTSSNIREELINLTGFREGALPITYLGVPLISSRLRNADSNMLVDLITSRITNWTSRFLSYAGRLQLVNSVLFAVQTYWASMFILPSGITNKLEKILSNFLWSGSSLKPPCLKGSWEDATRPRKEGGLGIKKLAKWNSAATLKHLWLIVLGAKGNIWIEWVKIYLLKGKSIWLANIFSRCLRAWRKLLSLRYLMNRFVA